MISHVKNISRVVLTLDSWQREILTTMAEPRNLICRLPWEDIPPIPPTREAMLSTPAEPRPLTAARVDAVLRRTESSTEDGFNVGTHNWHDDRTGTRSTSPIRANSRRRRSVASAPDGSGLLHISRGRQYSTEVRDRASAMSLSRASSRFRGGTRQRSPSRGRTRRRDNTPYPRDATQSLQNRKVNRQRIISKRPEGVTNEIFRKSRGGSRATSNTSGEGSRRSIETCSSTTSNSEASSYVAKGTFLLHKAREKDEFRLPKANSQPDPVWRPGDGFSGDEARPDFIFSMTGSRKRKRSGSLSGIGKLQVEAEKVGKNSSSSPAASRPRIEHMMQRRINYRSSGMKEMWPTLENFKDASISLSPRREGLSSENNTYQTLSPSPSPVSVPRMAGQYVPQRNRGPSDFENFGRPTQVLPGGPFECLPRYRNLTFGLGPNGRSNENDEGEESGCYDSETSVIPGTDYSDGNDLEDGHSNSRSPMDLVSMTEDLYACNELER
ncbi:hypothetical protein F4775DRAFT_574018 [Biscogniauxia sp. FL1348]|nr:hypothetical protein F4775DRAFT_574018 [Biscogniauxia sp. FL1348]